MSVVALVKLEAVQGKAEQALAIIKKSQAYCLSHEVCHGFEALQSCEDDHHFYFVERWHSIQAHKALLQQLMSDQTFVQSLEVFSVGPVIEYLTVQ